MSDDSSTFAAIIAFAVTFVIAGAMTHFIKPKDSCLRYEQRLVEGHYARGPKHHIGAYWVSDKLVDFCVDKPKPID